MCFKIWHSRFALKLTGVFQQVHVKCWSFRTADVNSAGRIVVFFRCLEVKMKNPWKSSVLGRLRYRHSDTVDLYRKRDVFLKLSRNKIHLPSGSEPTTAASATTPKGDWNEFIMQNDDSNLRIFLCIPRCFSKFGHPFWESKVPMMRHFSLGERSLRFLITRWCGIPSPLEISAEFAFAVAPQRWKQLMCHPVLLNADANGHVFCIFRPIPCPSVIFRCFSRHESDEWHISPVFFGSCGSPILWKQYERSLKTVDVALAP